MFSCFFFHKDSAPTGIYTLSLHDALPISGRAPHPSAVGLTFVATTGTGSPIASGSRSEEHTSELQSPDQLVCRLLLEKKTATIRRLFPESTASYGVLPTSGNYTSLWYNFV